MARSTPPRYGSLCENRLSTGLRARRHTMPRAPNSAARPVVAARKSWSPRRTQLPTNAIAHGNTTVSSPTAAPIAARPAAGRHSHDVSHERQRRHEQEDSGQHEQRHGGQPQLAWHVERGRQGTEDVELRLDRLAPDQPADRPGDGGDEGAEHGDVERDVEQGSDQRAPEASRAVAQEAVLRRLRVLDRRVEPVDDVGRGVSGAVVDAGQRPRRRRVVAARHGGQPAGSGHHAGAFELVEGAEGERRGADASAGAAHAEVSRRRQLAHRDRLIRPRDRRRRLLAAGEGEQADRRHAEQAEAVGEHLQPRQRRDQRRRGEVVGIGEAVVVGAEGGPRDDVLEHVDRRGEERQGDHEPFPALQAGSLVERPPAPQDPTGGDRVAGDQHTVGEQRRPRLAEVVAATADPLGEAGVGTGELRALVEVGTRRRP